MRDRNVRMVVLARFVSRAGGFAGFFVGVWGKAAYDLGADPFGLALLMAVLGLGGIIGSAAAGVAIDRADPRRVLVAAELVFVPSVLALVAADSLWSMTLLVAPMATFGAMVFTAVSSFPPFLVREHRALERANAAVEAAGTLGLIVGPAAGAVLVGLWGVDAVFVFDAATSLAAAALVVPVRVLDVERAPAQAGLRDLRAGFTYVYRTPAVRVLLVLGSLTYLSFGAFGALEPLFFRDVLERGPETLGWVNSVFGLGLTAGAAIYGRLPPSWTSARLLVAGTAAGGLGAATYTVSDDLRVVLVGAVFWSVVLGVLLPLVRTLAHLWTPAPLVGRVMGAFGVHQQAGDLLPLTFAPALAAVFGPQAVLVASGLALAAVAPLGLPAARRADRSHGAVRATRDGHAGLVEEPAGLA